METKAPGAPEPAARPPGVGGFLPTLARWVLAVFFREVRVEGVERIPRGPLVLVANHINALVDPALLLGFLPVRPRFLAKSTLWEVAILRPFLRLAAAIPVHRRQDAGEGADPAKNAEAFARCHEALAAGGTVALFPEGVSHNEPALVELKTGVSRIVLEAERRFPGIGIRVVPIGLVFEEKERFRSRVLVVVGEPLDPAPELAAYDADPVAAVQSLTRRIRDGLRDVTLNFPSWDEARLLARAAELYLRPTSELPAELDQRQRFAVQRAFTDGYVRLHDRAPAKVAAVASAVAAYDDRLELAGLRDRHLASSYPPRLVLLFVGRSLLRLLVRLPLAIVGTALSIVPFQLVDTLARRRGVTPDLEATYKLFGSLLLYPVAWALEAAAVGLTAGDWRWGALALLVAPPSSWVALRFHERGGRFRDEAGAYLRLLFRRGTTAELRRMRGDLLGSIRELAKEDAAASL